MRGDTYHGPEAGYRLSESGRRLTPAKGRELARLFATDGGPTILELAEELGVGKGAIRGAIDRTIGKDRRCEISFSRMAKRMHGNTRMKGKRHRPETIALMTEQKLGEKNPNWQGGRPHRYLRTRRWRRFRDRIVERDGACVRCGSDEYLAAHHKVPVRIDPDRIYDETNCEALCPPCHKAADDEYRGAERRRT
jgi:5-methylcytosine-specific restriction endonuclease McrA